MQPNRIAQTLADLGALVCPGEIDNHEAEQPAATATGATIKDNAGRER